jgi:hypothetical protein
MPDPKHIKRKGPGAENPGHFAASTRGVRLPVMTENRFGKHTAEVDAILNKLEFVTEAQLNQLAAEWSRAFSVDTDEELDARNEMRTAMFQAVKSQVGDDLLEVVEYYARQPVKNVIGRAPDYAPGFIASWNAIRDAISANLIRDSLTEKQYDKLMQPWANAMDQPHEGS